VHQGVPVVVFPDPGLRQMQDLPGFGP
jgi:hypothetical protein